MSNCAIGRDDMIYWHRRITRFVLALCLLLTAYSVCAETRVGVLYPESAPAFVKLYQSIIGGMGQAADVRLHVRAVSERDSADDLRAWLSANQDQAMVVLGELPPALTGPLASTVPVLFGASALNDNALAGVSLAASPAQMFSRLRLLKPDVERIYVVYKPQATAWLIAAGRAAAREHGLELVASPCDDVQQSTAAFSRIVQQARPDKDAIWLTLDPVVPLNQLLPVLLRESWERRLVLFSNNPVDVAKGALFALYPDYPAMGRQLVERAKRSVRSSSAGPEASERLSGALNVRTAAHLGITLTDQQRQAFSRFFPEASE